MIALPRIEGKEIRLGPRRVRAPAGAKNRKNTPSNYFQ